MESLALAVTIVLGTLLLSTIIAFVLSFFTHIVARIFTYVFAASGAIVGGLLAFDPNGNINTLIIGGVPLLICIFSVYNSFRVQRRKSKKANLNK